MKFVKTYILIAAFILVCTNPILNLNLKQNQVKKERGFSAQLFSPERGMDFLKNVAKAVFDEGENPQKVAEFRKNFFFCIRHFEDGKKEANEPKLREFYDKCYSIKDNAEKWNEDIMKDTIIHQIFQESFTIDAETKVCGHYLEEKLLKKPKIEELTQAFDKEFKGFNTSIPNEKIITSMFHQHRDLLDKGAFQRLNSISRS